MSSFTSKTDLFDLVQFRNKFLDFAGKLESQIVSNLALRYIEVRQNISYG